MLVLLYEFPAETRLTVYRRLEIAKRARVGPRTQVVLTMKMLFLKLSQFESDVGSPIIVLDHVCSKKCLLITIIVLDNVLKI